MTKFEHQVILGYIRGARDAFRDAANWEHEAWTSYGASKGAKPETRDRLLLRAWEELWRAACADTEGHLLLELARELRRPS